MSINTRDRSVIEAYLRQQHDGVALFRALTPETPGVPPGTPNQLEMFTTDATEMLIRGGNRAGKTICSAVRFAAIAKDAHVYTWDGQRHRVRRPHQRNHPLTMWVIGLQLNHIGQTIYRVLFRPGLYKIIPDANTGEWRSYREWDSVDKAREHLCKPSPPLIRPSEIDPDGWSWENKAAREFTKCTLKNGTEIFGFASTADVKQGDPVDIIWIDERIRFATHYPEWRMRLLDRKGSMYWSSKGFAGNPAMSELTVKAEQQTKEVEEGTRKQADIVEIRLVTSNNPYIDADEKRKARESLSEEEWAVRDRGEYETANSLIYPYFDERLYTAIPESRSADDLIAAVLRANNGVPPNDWCHEFILDPGTRKPAGLFGAIPPENLWDGNQPVLVVYDEIYGSRMDAEAMAQAVDDKTPPGRIYQRFIIDGQAARQTPMGFTENVEVNYSNAFSKRRLTCVETGSGFTIGNPDFVSRKMKVDQVLQLQNNGQPRLRVVTERCRNLVWQMTHNYYVIDNSGNVDDRKPAPKQKDDVRESLEYWVSRNPRYIVPPRSSERSSDPYSSFRDWWESRFGKSSESRSVVEIGGSL